MTEDIEIIKAVASDSKARIDRIILNYEELEKENAELKAREKALGERVLQLEKDKGKLIDENRRLKAQIEYMKCCENCKHDCECDGVELCDKWELM